MAELLCISVIFNGDILFIHIDTIAILYFWKIDPNAG